MRYLFTLVLTLLCLTRVCAQVVKLDFRDTPLARALAQIDALYPDTHLHFVVDEVTPYRVSLTSEASSARQAVSLVTASLPFSILEEGQELFVNKRQELESHPTYVSSVDTLIRSYRLQEILVLKDQLGFAPSAEGWVLDLSRSDLSHRGSAIDVLSYLPGMNYQEGRLVGYDEASVVIYVDDVAVNNVTELFSLRSEEISRVAYIESASSSYQSQSGAVIKIYTHQAAPGWNVQAQAQTSIGERMSHAEMARLSWHSDRVRLTTGITYNRSNEYQKHRAPDFNLILKPEISSVNPYLQATYRITPHHTVGIKYDMMDIIRPVSYWSKAVSMGSVGPFDFNNVAGLSGHNLSPEWSLHYTPRHDGRLYYRGELGGWHLDMDLGYYGDAMKIVQDEYGQTYQRINGIDNTLWTERLEATVPIGQLTISMGNEFTSTQRKDRYTRQYLETAKMGMDRNERQSVLFAMAAWQRQKTTLHVGLRYEYLYCTSQQSVKKVTRRYNYLQPHADLSWPCGKSTISLSYSMRTQRPSYDQLNGYTRFNQYLLFISGNPDLKPSIHHHFGLNYRHKDLNASLKYQHIKDYLANIVTRETELYRSRYDNLASADQMMATVTYSPQWQHWKPILSSSLLAQDVDLVFTDGTHRRLNRPVWHIDLHCPYMIGPHAQVWIDWHHHTAGNVGSNHQGTTGMVNLGCSYQWLHWDLRLQAEDLFRTGKTTLESYGPSIVYRHSTYSDTRRVGLALCYHWK